MGLDHNQNGVFDIEIPTYARFGATEIGSRRSVVDFRVVTLSNPVKDRLELVCFSQGERAKPVTVPARRWRLVRKDEWIARTTMSSVSSGLEAKLLAGKEVIDVTRAEPASSMHFFHRQLDNYSYLDRLLGFTRHKPESHEFEVGVLNLFGLVGFPAIYYGHGGTHPFPDVMAQLDPTTFLLAECTTGVPEPVKLGKLNDRVVALRAAARKEFVGTQIIGAIFGTRSSMDIDADIRRRAGALRIAIVSHDRVRDLLTFATCQDQRKFRRTLLRAIPPIR